MRLFLVRHGAAADRMTWAGNDADRPLVEKGKLVTARVAEALAAAGVSPGALLSSPYVRASETAAILAETLDTPGGVVEDERLSPGFSLAALTAILSEVVGADEVMLVGHEPDMSEVTAALVGGARVVFKKSAIARIDLWDPDVPSGDLRWLAPPGLLAP